ncbi:SpoIIE family protein phosphatase [Streptomyces thermocarboxydovorans]|uniref:SpoIIE family protein phosphatase n=1 Tax=Streptomyces thermocarboxydovorans TaxID=59298 RepID=A0ABP3SUJ7_9ACTN
MDRLREQTAMSGVVERAKGVVMALTGCSADAAAETLLQRAKAARHSLLEECWITLGEVTPTPPPDTGPATTEACDRHGTPDSPAGDDQPDDVADALSRLGRALVRVETPQDLAGCLLEHLAADLGADAVMIYVRRPAGHLELFGHAGIDEELSARWNQVPPFSGVAPVKTVETGRAHWLENFTEDSKRYALIGEPSSRWRSRVWLPVPPSENAEYCIGVLREREGPFTPRDRGHLRGVVRLCAGRLRAFATPQDVPAQGLASAATALFEALPVPAMLLAPVRAPGGEVEDFRIDAVTAQAVGLLRGTGNDPAGRRLREYREELPDESLWQGCLHALATGEPYDGKPFAHEKLVDGVAELATCSVRVSRLDDALLLTWVRHASSDRQEQRLADLQRLGSLGWAHWNLTTSVASWSSQVFTILGRDPGLGPLRLDDLPALALNDDRPRLDRAIERLLQEGKPFDAPFRIRTPRGLRHLRLVAEAVSGMDGTPVEVHGFVQDVSERRRAELALVESERAILTQHDVLQAERTLVAHLQHALLPLPGQPVGMSGLHVEVAYLPAQAGISVGGDWFSAIELPDGDALFVVGDVAGHGVDAVATMAQLRFTAKGMVITGSSLTGALARLNTLLLHSRDSHGTATMILARYEPTDRSLVWAQAGHTPLLLLRDGEVTYLPRPRGMLLGATAAPPYEEARFRLQPGDRLLMYTDGLVERPPENLDKGLDRLARAVAADLDDEPGSLSRLLDAMLQDERRDDVCVLDIRVPREPHG